MRAFVSTVLFALFVAACCSPLAAQTYPIPFVSNPTIPAAIPPGGAAFTLTVNGAGFVAGEVVRWNGVPLLTTFVGGTQLTAQVPATDIAANGIIFVTVATPIGATSDSVLFDVSAPTSSLAFTRIDTDYSLSSSPDNPEIARPILLTLADFSSDGTPDLAIVNSTCPAELNCVQEKDSITISDYGAFVASQTFTAIAPSMVGTGDFNGDGFPDLITVGPINFSILLHLSNSLQFSLHVDHPLPAGCSYPFVLGDFNRDGHLDLMLTGSSGACLLLGNGDGTFGPSTSIDSGTVVPLATGDFNGDGNLDVIVADPIANTISILLGNGDGTFQASTELSANPVLGDMLAADLNGDGILDLAVVSAAKNVSIFLGNGNGTFRPNIDYPAAVAVASLTMGDYNGDGIVDLAVTDTQCATPGCLTAGSVNVLLGNGDGTFQSPLDFAIGGPPYALATGGFVYSGEPSSLVGRPGLATANKLQNTVSLLIAIPTGNGNSVPTVSSISPLSALINSGAFTLTVNGTNFISGATVFFNGQALATTFVSATQLTAAIQAGDLSSVGAVNVFVANAPPARADSTSVAFSIFGPPPSISSLSPSSAVAGGPAFILTVNGLNFLNVQAVNFNGTPRPTTIISSTQLSISISAGDIANQGAINISVTDSSVNGFGGGTSLTLPLRILPTNTQPVVGALSPASTTAGGPAFTITLSGSGFTSSSIVTFNSSIVSSAFVSQTQLQAAIPASAIAAAGTPFVTAANPGGSPSLVVTFVVNNPVPGTSSLSPPGVPAGNAAITLSITGTNFNISSAVLANGTPRATTFVSSTLLHAALPAGDFAHGGTLSITVTNPAPGGGVTPALAFAVEDFNLNVQTPTASVTAGQQATFNLMVVPAGATITSAVSLTASITPTPAGATASFSPATIPAGNGTTVVMLTVATTAHAVVPASKFPRLPWPREPLLFVLVLELLSMWLGLRLMNSRVPRFNPQFWLVAVLVVAAGLISCGGGSGSPSSASSSGSVANPAAGTAAGTYSIVVTATSNTGSTSSTVTLMVM